jgi:hypothetical protein
MTDLNETLAGMQAKTDAATRGLWQVDGPAYHFYGDGDGDFVNSSVVTAGPERLPVATMSPPLIGDVIAWGGLARRFESDAEFIAMARTAMPALLSAVQNVLAIEPARSDGNALSRASGYNTALADVRKALTDALEGGEAS